MSDRRTVPTGEALPLLVKPKAAWKMLACSNTRGYQLLNTRELDSFLDGRARKIAVESIHRYIMRRLALTDKSVSANLAQQLAPADNSVSTNAQSRRRGRPRKSFVQERVA